MEPKLALIGRLGRLIRASTEGWGPKTKEWLRAQWKGTVGRTGREVGLPEGERTLREALKSYAKHPIKGTREGWKSMPTWEKALLTGTTAMELPGLAKAKGQAKGKHIGSMVGSTAGWLALRRMPFAAQILGWEALGRLGGYAGGKIARKSKGLPKPSSPSSPYAQYVRE